MQNFILRELHPGTQIEGINLSQKGFIVGNRYLKDYFFSTRICQSDNAIYPGSSHLALKDQDPELDAEKESILINTSRLEAISAGKPGLMPANIMAKGRPNSK